MTVVLQQQSGWGLWHSALSWKARWSLKDKWTCSTFYCLLSILDIEAQEIIFSKSLLNFWSCGPSFRCVQSHFSPAFPCQKNSNEANSDSSIIHLSIRQLFVKDCLTGNVGGLHSFVCCEHTHSSQTPCGSIWKAIGLTKLVSFTWKSEFQIYWSFLALILLLNAFFD